MKPRSTRGISTDRDLGNFVVGLLIDLLQAEIPTNLLAKGTEKDFLCPPAKLARRCRLWQRGLPLQLWIVQLGRRRFINDIGLRIAQGLLGQPQIGTTRFSKPARISGLGLVSALAKNSATLNRVVVPRGQGPLCFFTQCFCAAARVKSFPETTETSLCFFTSARKSYPPKEHIANREQIVYIADFGRFRRCSRAALSGGRIPAIRSATS
jgi:hypothetical protein